MKTINLSRSLKQQSLDVAWCSGQHTWLSFWRTQVQIPTQMWMHIFPTFFFFQFAGVYRQLGAESYIHLFSNNFISSCLAFNRLCKIQIQKLDIKSLNKCGALWSSQLIRHQVCLRPQGTGDRMPAEDIKNCIK